MRIRLEYEAGALRKSMEINGGDFTKKDLKRVLKLMTKWLRGDLDD